MSTQVSTERPTSDEVAARLDQELADWRAELTQGEEVALRRYQGSLGGLINAVLRDEVDPATLPLGLPDVVAETIEDLDSAIEKAILTEQTTVYRGIRNAERALGTEEIPLAVGDTRRDQGFMSTTLEREIAEVDFANPREGCVVELACPAGTQAAWMPLVSTNAFKKERELLLARDTAFRVVEVSAGPGTPMIRAEVRP